MDSIPAPPFLILEFRRRKVCVPRPQWLTYEGALGMVQSTFPSLHNTPLENIVLMTPIPGYSNLGNVEISKEGWSVLYSSITFVKIGFKHDRLALEDKT